MSKIKIKVEDVFGLMSGVSINGVILDSNNINDYDLYKMPRKSNEKEDVYKISKQDKGFYIVHNKVDGTVDWCECLD